LFVFIINKFNCIIIIN